VGVVKEGVGGTGEGSLEGWPGRGWTGPMPTAREMVVVIEFIEMQRCSSSSSAIGDDCSLPLPLRWLEAPHVISLFRQEKHSWDIGNSTVCTTSVPVRKACAYPYVINLVNIISIVQHQKLHH
jgi:hypothetical protein